MKRKLIYFMIVVGLATAVTLKVSQNKDYRIMYNLII